VFPTGPTDDGLPIGVQAMGGEYHDRTTLALAARLADPARRRATSAACAASGSARRAVSCGRTAPWRASSPISTR
jgi:hypothetical protein